MLQWATSRKPDWTDCVGGITVSIAAFQAVDPGSTPGRRSAVFSCRSGSGPTGGLSPLPLHWLDIKGATWVSARLSLWYRVAGYSQCLRGAIG